jgi:flavin reductase
MDSDMSIAFRAVMRGTAASVSIVTSRHASGPQGLVATSVVSISMDPPTILYCVNKSSSFHAVVQAGQPFCVNFLSADDVVIARHFGATKGPERFSRGVWSSEDAAVPWLRSAQATVFGTIVTVVDWHTHSIVCGRVLKAATRAGARPLLYTMGDFIDSNAGQMTQY